MARQKNNYNRAYDKGVRHAIYSSRWFSTKDVEEILEDLRVWEQTAKLRVHWKANYEKSGGKAEWLKDWETMVWRH